MEERLTKPLRAGSRLAITGLVVVLAAQALTPASVNAWLLNLVGVILTAWGGVRVLTWVARLRGRRSLTEAAVGIGLLGAAEALTVTAAQGPQDRENTWILGIAAIGFAVLGLALMGSAVADFRGEARRSETPPQPPEGAITKPQPAGTPLQEHEVSVLRLTLAVVTVSCLVTLVVSFIR